MVATDVAVVIDVPMAAVIAGLATEALSVDGDFAEWFREAGVGGKVEPVGAENAAVFAVVGASDVDAAVIAANSADAAVVDSTVVLAASVALGAIVPDCLGTAVDAETVDAVDAKISVVADVDDDAIVVGTACTGAGIFSGIAMHISALVCSYETLGGSIAAEDDEFKSPIDAFSTTTEGARFVITIGLRHLIEGGADLVDGDVFHGSLIVGFAGLFSR